MVQAVYERWRSGRQVGCVKLDVDVNSSRSRKILLAFNLDGLESCRRNYIVLTTPAKLDVVLMQYLAELRTYLALKNTIISIGRFLHLGIKVTLLIGKGEPCQLWGVLPISRMAAILVCLIAAQNKQG